MRTTFALLIAAMVLTGLTGCHDVVEEITLNRDVLYQVSTIGALQAGIYDGPWRVEDLQFQGDFGIGTYNGLDGELVAVGGAFYQITADGVARPITEDTVDQECPFAMMTFFEVDQTVAVHGLANYEQLRQHVDNFISRPNAFYALRIDGRFRYVRVRSVPKQQPPYLPLDNVLRNQQQVYEFHNQEGTIIGYRLPNYIDGVSTPGYHLHFVTADRRLGGHMLEVEVEGVDVHLDLTEELHLVLPESEAFNTANVDRSTVDLMDLE